MIICEIPTCSQKKSITSSNSSTTKGSSCRKSKSRYGGNNYIISSNIVANSKHYANHFFMVAKLYNAIFSSTTQPTTHICCKELSRGNIVLLCGVFQSTFQYHIFTKCPCNIVGWVVIWFVESGGEIQSKEVVDHCSVYYTLNPDKVYFDVGTNKADSAFHVFLVQGYRSCSIC